MCGYLNNDVIQPLCVILPQMNGNIKYFDDGGKNMSFVTDDEKIYEKYNEIWEVVRKLLKIKFTVGPIRDDKYLMEQIEQHLLIMLFLLKKIIIIAFLQ